MNQRELSQDGKYFANLENQLRVVKGSNEIYRCEGRLSNANSIPYQTRSTILPARKQNFPELIVLDCHQRVLDSDKH